MNDINKLITHAVAGVLVMNGAEIGVWRCPVCNAWDRALCGADVHGIFTCDECGAVFRIDAANPKEIEIAAREVVKMRRESTQGLGNTIPLRLAQAIDRLARLLGEKDGPAPLKTGGAR